MSATVFCSNDSYIGLHSSCLREFDIKEIPGDGWTLVFYCTAGCHYSDSCGFIYIISIAVFKILFSSHVCRLLVSAFPFFPRYISSSITEFSDLLIINWHSSSKG